ncbi:MAG TPA: response regulator [Polyangiaceae bacterium]|jgi:CheY-like chemotaxis protein|nr:response regulator [Polyangiaceae bacterium]
MRIIFADGHDNFRGVVSELLRDEGHEVHAVSLGGELATTARRVEVDVIVSHVRFADLGALEALEHLAASNVRVPTILMSGDVRSIPHADAARLGVIGYLEKPFSMAELRVALQAVARFRRIALVAS